MKAIQYAAFLVVLAAGAPLTAQHLNTNGSFRNKTDIGLNFTYKMAKGSEASNSYFIQGGSLDAAYTPGGKLKGLGLAVDASGAYASSIYPGVDLTQLVFVAGPRYTQRESRASIYVESLYGVVHVYHTALFTSFGSVLSSAVRFASQSGGGLNLQLSNHIAWRVAEVDYIYTDLPNTTTNRQSATRMSSGIAFHF